MLMDSTKKTGTKSLFEIHRGCDGNPIPYFRVVEQKGEQYLMCFGGENMWWGTIDMVRQAISLQETFNNTQRRGRGEVK